MKIKLLAYILLFFSVVGCGAGGNGEAAIYDAGVSHALAQLRKENISNVNYSLCFSVPECKDSAVYGNAGISFDIDAPQEIVFDFSEEQNVNTVSVNGSRAEYNIHNEHIIIPASFFKKGTNTVDITFVAGDRSLNRNDDFLYTLLVPDRARTVFPCFDQPDMKATFRLALYVPEAWTAVSNSAVLSEVFNGGYRHIIFAPTEPLSTYLFSFVAGVFKKDIYNDGRRTFAAYHRETDPKRVAQLPVIFS
ncbi:MAG: aminopeptidase, partial [Bacteroidaceae bacterium]|nr:aminopeptidase [Bacteroidaceae bacterium]